MYLCQENAFSVGTTKLRPIATNWRQEQLRANVREAGPKKWRILNGTIPAIAP